MAGRGIRAEAGCNSPLYRVLWRVTAGSVVVAEGLTGAEAFSEMLRSADRFPDRPVFRDPYRVPAAGAGAREVIA